MIKKKDQAQDRTGGGRGTFFVRASVCMCVRVRAHACVQALQNMYLSLSLSCPQLLPKP